VAAGYAPTTLQQQLQHLTAVIQAVDDSTVSVDSKRECYLGDSSHLQEISQQLQAAGSALCSFAVPCLCNNPACSNMAGLTELGLVSGRSCICGGCRVARYCGRACQRAAWKQHKPLCAGLAGLAAAASGAVVLQEIPHTPGHGRVAVHALGVGAPVVCSPR
jgi:hypothetical protein